MSQLKTYDPAKLSIVFAGIPIQGFAEDTLVKVTRAEKSFNLKVGTTGEAARARNRNRSGTVTFTLLQTSASNDALSSKLQEDELTGTGTGPLLVADNLGTTVINGDQCFLEKPADVEFGKEIQAREWTVVVPDLDMFVGGAVVG